MRRWQFDVLFGIAAGGAVFLIFAQKLGIELSPTALTGYGAILTYVLTQRGSWTNKSNGSGKDNPPPDNRSIVERITDKLNERDTRPEDREHSPPDGSGDDA